MTSTCTKSKLPGLFMLADSISIHYGPYLERFLTGQYACDRKGRELLELPSFASEAESGAGILARLDALDPGIPELNGGDSRAVLAYLRQRPPKCDVLLLNCGLHDLKVDPASRARQVPLDEYGRNLNEILVLARRCAPQVVWVRTTPVDDAVHNRLKTDFQRFNADVLSYNAVADACIRSAGVTSVDLYGFTCCLAAGEPGGLAALIADHIHFTHSTRRLQAAYLAGRLEALHAG